MQIVPQAGDSACGGGKFASAYGSMDVTVVLPSHFEVVRYIAIDLSNRTLR